LPEEDEVEREARLERARQLREEIEALKEGRLPDQPAGPKSIKEQIAERVHDRETERNQS